ncbi:MAG: AAA family ATPase [Bacteroidetes bacterium]|nr:AAA family ATPase [Bacteroidota bacterium]
MEHFIKYVDIHNFKSIKDLRLDDCRRINIFLGYPNVGKSNVLEALSLFSLPFLKDGESLNKLVRVENKNELFYDVSEQMYYDIMATNQGRITFGKEPQLIIQIDNNWGGNFWFSDDLKYDCPKYFGLEPKVLSKFPSGNIKRYTFQTNNQWKFTGDSQLLPPFGENIVETLSYNPNVNEVNEWIAKECAKYNLEYVMDFDSNSVKVQKRLSENKVRQFPYSSIADTLQRLIFYKTAIASNKNSVLLFEEPEAHAFPPYIQTVMQDIIDAESNQFFIVTHSPLVVNAFLEYEKLRKETSIYVFDYKNDQTTAKRLSDEEMELAYEYGNDLFFNLENLLVDGL